MPDNSRHACSNEGISSSPTQPFNRACVVLAGTLLLYFTACILMLPGYMVLPMMLLPGIPFLFFFMPDPRRWLLLLPLAIALGYTEISLGPFPLLLAVAFLFFGYLVYFLAKTASCSPAPPFGVFSRLLMFAYLAQMTSLFVSIHVNGQHVLNAVRESHKFFIPALLPLIILDWYGEKGWFDRMLKAFVLTLLVLSVYGVYQFHSGSAWSVGEVASGYHIAGRAFSTIRGGANSYSGFLELTVPASLAAAFYFRSKSWKAVCFTAVGLGILNGLYTYSRGGFLTISLSCIIYLIYRFRRKVWVPIISAAVFIGVVAGNAQTFERQVVMITDPSSVVFEATLLHRYVSYSRYLMDIRANLLSGVGWGAKEFYSGGSSLYSFWEVRHEQSTEHIRNFGGLNSLFFDMVLKGGIASALSLLLIIALAVYASLKALRYRCESDLAVGFVSGLAAFGTHQIVDNLLQWPQTGSFFWISLGMLAVLGREHTVKPYNTRVDHENENDCGAETPPGLLRE